ncbi:unnamed protein product [Protopolystoma xenopodis]|uniref:Uncharacterized protein n=1 Tax=Protopolystoma xenopodis TaxID=117903 RepID=A0A3S5AES9_9PLAT|nr:unnamed protein product [Protopolystoma xenopodis]
MRRRDALSHVQAGTVIGPGTSFICNPGPDNRTRWTDAQCKCTACRQCMKHKEIACQEVHVSLFCRKPHSSARSDTGSRPYQPDLQFPCATDVAETLGLL